MPTLATTVQATPVNTRPNFLSFDRLTLTSSLTLEIDCGYTLVQKFSTIEPAGVGVRVRADGG